MKLGLFTVLYPELDLESILECAQQLGCGALEFSSLPGRGLRHFDPVEINRSTLVRERFQEELRKRDFIISQLNCSCNALSPDPEQARQAREAFELTFQLAEKLNVRTVGSFSGCPGGCADDRTPNWITCPWPPEYLQMLKWQWEERLIPFWTWAAERAAQFGVTQLAIEMHPGFCVYNPASARSSRAGYRRKSRSVTSCMAGHRYPGGDPGAQRCDLACPCEGCLRGYAECTAQWCSGYQALFPRSGARVDLPDSWGRHG